MSTIDPASHFDRERAEGYDHRVRYLIPGYSVIHELSKSLLESCLSARAKILVAGAGTGNEAIFLAGDNPDWKITGFDPAPEMIKIARSKVDEKGLGGRISLVEGFVPSVKKKPLFDAATAILVMHFLPDDGSKDRFAHEISKRLKPGAKFILADLEGDTKSENFRMLVSAWKRHLLSVVEDSKKVEETFENIMKNVKFRPESRIRKILKNAGFEKTDKFFQGYLTSGYIAVKSAD
ncbi:class I SAM-dependent methyltransferase [Candidatus Mycalebacterium sp.]